MTEKILVFQKKLIDKFCFDCQATTKTEDLVDFVRNCLSKAYFVDRDKAETDESILQIIPYVIIRHKNLFGTYKRSKKGGEKRLYDKLSIGLGGHINMTDLEYAMRDSKSLATDYRSCQELALARGMAREIFEETGWSDHDINAKLQMLVYDNSTPVGRVHFGLILVAYIDKIKDIDSQEDEISNFEWKTKEELLVIENRLENWSRIYLASLSTEVKNGKRTNISPLSV